MDDWDEDETTERRPLVTERLRRLGWLALVLVPLLVIALAQVPVPVSWALVILIGGLVLLVALRDRDDD